MINFAGKDDMEPRTRKQIPDEEYNAFNWACFWNIELGEWLYLPTNRRTYPPDDGYEYSDVTAMGDKEQHWIRGDLKEPKTN